MPGKFCLCLFSIWVVAVCGYSFNYLPYYQTDLLGAGHYKIEMGGVYSSSAAGSSTLFFLKPQIGITDHLSVALTVPLGVTSGAGGGSGIGDVGISAKYLVSPQKHSTKITLQGGFIMPTGNVAKRLGNGKLEGYLGVGIKQPLANGKFNLYTDAGFFRGGNTLSAASLNGNSPFGGYYSVGMDYALTDYVKVFGGVSGTTLPKAYGGTNIYYDLGAVFKISDKITIPIMISNLPFSYPFSDY
jgi:hypothetical protein